MPVRIRSQTRPEIEAYECHRDNSGEGYLPPLAVSVSSESREFAPTALIPGRYNISLISEGPYIHPSGVSPPSGVIANGDAVAVYKCVREHR